MTDDANPAALPSDDAPELDGDASTPGGETPPAQPAGALGPALKTADPPPPAPRPNYLSLAVVAIASLALDLGSKWWAKMRLPEGRITVIKDHLAFKYAENPGGAWGLLQDEPESIRRPFFLGISVLAIVFIVSLYRKLTPQQWALRWGLPLVLGGALGNLVNRIQYNYVVDFIDYRAGWVRALNGLLSRSPTNQWPTFNVADVAIVAGVVLMAIDMFTPAKRASGAGGPPAGPSDEVPSPGPTHVEARLVSAPPAAPPSEPAP